MHLCLQVKARKLPRKASYSTLSSASPTTSDVTEILLSHRRLDDGPGHSRVSLVWSSCSRPRARRTMPTKEQQKASEAPVDLAGLKNRAAAHHPQKNGKTKKLSPRSAIEVLHHILPGHGLDSLTASETQSETLVVSTSRARRLNPVHCRVRPSNPRQLEQRIKQMP